MNEIETQLPLWAKAYGGAQSTGVIRTVPDDFIVNEIQLFELSGEGEHAFLHIEKCNENTDYIARILARFAGVRQRDVSYAGLKDRHARTTQWFSVWLPGKPDPDWSELNSESLKVLQATRHSRKLKRGSLAGNQFTLNIRNWLGDKDILEQQLTQIKSQGVPNYFGAQRFGRNGANINKALGLFGGAKLSRNLRGMYLSAARSYLFNQIVSQRVENASWNQALEGDLLMFTDSHSFFKADLSDATVAERITTLDTHPTAALWGRGELETSESIAELENKIATEHPEIAKGLIKFGLEQDRRAMRSQVKDLQWVFIDEECLELKFSLNAGSYATAVLREIVDLKNQ
jgi:tRNA pseudouridine13 synthase